MKRTAKSLLAMLVVLTLLVAAVPFAMSTAAVEDAQGNVWSVDSGRISGVTLADGVDPATAVLTLPTGYTELWSYGNWPDVKKYIIPDGYTKVTVNATYPAPFKGMTNLEEVVFPEGMTTIGTFEGCTNLKCLKIPMSVTQNSTADIFKGCTSLVSVDLGGLGKMSYGVGLGIFENNPALKFIYVNSSISGRSLVNSSLEGMVGDSTQGITIVLGENVTSIYAKAFTKMYINEVVWNSNTFSFNDSTAWFNDCVFVGGSISAGNNNLYRQFLSNSTGTAANAQVRTVDGKFDIYFGADATYAGNTSRPFLSMNNWNTADEINLYYEGAETLGVENYIFYVDGGQKLTPTINVHTNASAYQYRYNRVNFDPYFGAPVTPPAEPTVDWLASKVQLAVGTTAESDSTSMRILSTVDSLDYDAAGIEITINDKTTTLNSTVVYESIYAASGEGAELVTPVQVSGVEDSQYIIAKEIINIPADAFDTEITIRAFCSVDETVSYGESRTVTVAGLI